MTERNKQYYEKNKERERKRSLEYYHQHREKKQSYMKEYQKTYRRPPLTPAKREEQNRKRRERYATDQLYRERYKNQSKTWGKQSPSRKRECRLKQDYGMEPGQYESLLAKQNGGCAICGAKITGVAEKNKAMRKLAVDHSHKTGKVRGLLCHHCNFGIGHFKDNPQLLMKAADYLTNL